MNSDIQSLENRLENQSNIRYTIEKYLSYWKWFLISLLISLSIGYYLTKFKTNIYEASASILVKNNGEESGISEVAAFKDLEILQNNQNTDNEIVLLKSKNLIRKVVDELNLRVQLYTENGPILKEHYSNPPLYIKTFKGDLIDSNLTAQFKVYITSEKTFNLLNLENNKLGSYEFGKHITTPFGDFLITPAKTNKKGWINSTVEVHISAIRDIVDQYRNSILIEPSEANFNVLRISLQDTDPEKAESIINSIVSHHLVESVSDKNSVTRNTLAFINERIELISEELSNIESNVENFKSKNSLFDINSEAEIFIEEENKYQNEEFSTSTQLKLTEYMYNFVVKLNKEPKLIPSNIGIEDATINNLTNQYNDLILERFRLIKTSGEKNPVIQNINEQIVTYQKRILESLSNVISPLKIKEKELSRKEDESSKKVAKIPSLERAYRTIQRQQQIKETLYLYLLQKREETAIALAVNSTNIKVIDDATGSSVKISTKKRKYIIIAFLIGFLSPILVLYFKDLLNTKVLVENDLKHLGIPFLGDIPIHRAKNKIVVGKNENSSISEAFRILRTHLNLLLSSKNVSKTIFITSTLSKEGKSFIASNLAATFSLSDYKVLLIELDLRSPKIMNYMNLNPTLGITHYISDKNIELKDLIIKSPTYEGLHILPSGIIPPNPSELMTHKKIDEIFKYAKENFDLIVVDTAPLGIVTDTLLLKKYADLFVYVVRANYLDKRLLKVPETMIRERRIENISFVLNCSELEKTFGYGYGYGYGDKIQKLTLFEKFLNFFK